MRNKYCLSAAVLLALGGGSKQTVAWADTTAAPTAELEEIVITAQKRTERLQDVPVSAAVLSSSTLNNSNVSDVSDLNKIVPSLNINGTISGRAPIGHSRRLQCVERTSDGRALGRRHHDRRRSRALRLLRRQPSRGHAERGSAEGASGHLGRAYGGVGCHQLRDL